jgi:hypothetical protein
LDGDDEKGPNDAGRVVWANFLVIVFLSCDVLLILTYFLIFYFSLINVLKGRGGLRWATTTKMGPKDVSYFFFIFCHVLASYIIYLGSIDVLKG